MVYMENDEKQSRLVVQSFDYGISKDHPSRLIKNFIEENFAYLDEKNKKKMGRPAFKKTTLLAVLFYAEYDGINSCSKISEYCEGNKYYSFISNGLVPSERTLQRFLHDFGDVYKEVNQLIVSTTEEEGFTDFNHVAIDGTIIKANNSNYNVIKKDDLLKIKEIISKEYSEDKIKEKDIKLGRAAYKLLLNDKMTDDEKLNYVDSLSNELKKSGQTSIGLNDTDARWMKNKKGLPELSYNMQSAVDYESKMIVSFDISQEPTDHYQLVKQIDNVKKDIGRKPDKISADTGYHTRSGILKLDDEDIDGYIPNRKQSKQGKGNLSSNPYHKDHFKYNYLTDSFICPENQELYLQATYNEKSKKPGTPDKIKRIYYNTDCYKCKLKDLCTKSKVRVITDYGDSLELAMSAKMDTEEAKNEYSKRSVVEAPFGILKTNTDFNNLPVEGSDQIINRVGLKVVAYNWKRLENLRKGEGENSTCLKNFVNNLKREYPDLFLLITIC